MSTFTSLPSELLHDIFRWVDPSDLASLPLVCREFYEYVTNNRKLHQDVYLCCMDEPSVSDLDWIKELRDLVRLQVICKRPDSMHKRGELEFVHSTVNNLLQHASSTGQLIENSSTHANSKNAALLHRIFEDDSNREAFLQRSFLFERVRNEHHHPVRYEETRNETHQMSAKLHCLYGKPILNVGRLRSTRTYPYACSKVYDLRQYTERAEWGPFMDDDSGRVDWEKLEAVLIVLGNNVYMKKIVSQIFADIWDSPFAGSWPKSYICPQPAEVSDLDARDPYGITGTWHQIVCFLDYNDFFAYNFPSGWPIPDSQPRPSLHVGEATRFIAMKIHVTAIEPPGPNDGQALPVVYFQGISKSLDDAWDDGTHAGARGMVRLTKEGEVRWTVFSVFHGQERWRSDSIQIGGVRSARGVVGSWFDADFDPHGPAGPTAFWKASDLESGGTTIRDILPVNYFLAYTSIVDMNQEGDTDPEGEMEYVADDDDDEEDENLTFEPEAGEVTGLLEDAEMEISTVTPQV